MENEKQKQNGKSWKIENKEKNKNIKQVYVNMQKLKLYSLVVIFKNQGANFSFQITSTSSFYVNKDSYRQRFLFKISMLLEIYFSFFDKSAKGEGMKLRVGKLV